MPSVARLAGALLLGAGGGLLGSWAVWQVFLTQMGWSTAGNLGPRLFPATVALGLLVAYRAFRRTGGPAPAQGKEEGATG